MSRPHFRFQDLEVWQDASGLAVVFHEVAAKLEERRFYRYAEQLRGAGLSPSNNIAEGSASHHDKEFIQFLNIARRSTAELASMALSFEKMQLIAPTDTDQLLEQADKVARKLTAFIRHLGSKQ
ncbi:four helix bundle protein [Haloferula sp. A504]|uniref:four helix bundle protein n=1 Tax=Haloferula sp. A504 TaxID=3373601 RepID=UPI0031CA642E|nr:four helix bundle protein [Verrucomicrobiaceae bacterium E54]